MEVASGDTLVTQRRKRRRSFTAWITRTNTSQLIQESRRFGRQTQRAVDPETGVRTEALSRVADHITPRLRSINKDKLSLFCVLSECVKKLCSMENVNDSGIRKEGEECNVDLSASNTSMSEQKQAGDMNETEVSMFNVPQSSPLVGIESKQSLLTNVNMSNFSDSDLFNGSSFNMNEQQTVEADTKFGILPIEQKKQGVEEQTNKPVGLQEMFSALMVNINQKFDVVNNNFAEVKQQSKQQTSAIKKLSDELEKYKAEINERIEQQAASLKMLWGADLQVMETKVDQRVSEVESKCNQFSNNIKSELTTVIKRVATVDQQRCEQVKENVHKVEQKIAAVEVWCSNEHQMLDDKIISEVEKCINNVNSVGERVNVVDNTIGAMSNTLHEHDTRLTKVEHNIKFNANGSNCGLVMGSAEVAYITNRQFLRFDPAGGVHPKEFWKDFEDVLPTMWSDKQKIGFIASKFMGEARIWGVTATEQYETLELFKEAFFKEYWGKQKQMELLNSFWNGEKFNPRKEGVKRFAMKWVNNLSYLNKKLEPEQIIMGLDAKLPINWRRDGMGAPREDVNKFISYLERVEKLMQEEEHANRNYRPQHNVEPKQTVNVNRVGVSHNNQDRGRGRGRGRGRWHGFANGEQDANDRSRFQEWGEDEIQSREQMDTPSRQDSENHGTGN